MLLSRNGISWEERKSPRRSMTGGELDPKGAGAAMKSAMRSRKVQQLKREIPLYIMLMPAVVILLVYAYGPMIGNVIAFQRFLPGRGLFGSEFIGLEENFIYVFKMPTYMERYI